MPEPCSFLIKVQTISTLHDVHMTEQYKVIVYIKKA